MNIRFTPRLLSLLVALVLGAGVLTAAALAHSRRATIHVPTDLTATPYMVTVSSDGATDPFVTLSLMVTVSSDGVTSHDRNEPATAKPGDDRVLLNVYYVNTDGSLDAKRAKKAWKVSDNSDDFGKDNNFPVGDSTGTYNFVVSPTKKTEKNATYRFVVTNPAVPNAQVVTNVQTR